MIRRLLCGTLVLFASRALAQDTTSGRGVRIGLTYDAGSRPLIAVLAVAGPTGDSVRAILERDLDYGDRIGLLPDVATPALLKRGAIDYPVATRLGVAGVLQATLVGGTQLHVVLHDVHASRVLQVEDVALPAPAFSPSWRMALHSASDEVERWITGIRGISATRIAFVRSGRVQLVDADGASSETVTPPGATALSPAWRPDGRAIAYTVFAAQGGTQVVVRELGGPVRTVSGATRGLNITPTFAPDGETIVWAHAEDSGTDLVAGSATDASPRSVTVGRGSDNVSPSVSPDGRRVAFTSARPGHPEVYISDIDGTNAELLTTYVYGEDSYRSNPDWSPDGRTVAYQAQVSGRFQLMTIALRDRATKQLTSDGTNEDPTWAPDSRHLVFTSSRTGARELWVLDTESGRVRQLTRGGGARMGAWSPWMGRAR